MLFPSLFIVVAVATAADGIAQWIVQRGKKARTRTIINSRVEQNSSSFKRRKQLARHSKIYGQE